MSSTPPWPGARPTPRIGGLRPGMVYVVQVRRRTVAGYGKFNGKMCFQTLTDRGAGR